MASNTPQDFIDRLHVDLLKARKTRDQPTTATLQSIISAIDNAGAVPVPKSITTTGTGSTEAPRRELSAEDIRDIVKREIAELQHAIKQLDDTKNPYVDEWRNKISILEKYL